MKVLKQLLERRSAVQTELDGLIEPTNGEQRTLSTEDETRADALLAELDTLDTDIETETRKAKRAQMIAEARQVAGIDQPQRNVTVSEPMMYGEESGHSHALDLARRSMAQFTGGSDGGANQRLAIWEHQVEREIANDSKIGKRAFRNVRESFRESGPNAASMVAEIRERGRIALELKGEQRAVGTGGGATASAGGGGGAAFVSPVIFLDEYAPFREAGREFANRCRKLNLPDYGMEMYIPSVSAGAAVATQTEGLAVTESDPTIGYLSAAIITTAGQVTVSQQLLDRAGPNFAFDQLIFDMLQRDYAPKWDQYVLAQSLANATSQAWTGNGGAWQLTAAGDSGGFQGQVQLAAATMEELDGTITSPTALFLKPSRWRYIEAYADTQGRPLIVPNIAGPMNALGAGAESGDHVYEGAVGYSFGGVPVYKDKNIPLASTRDQAIVADMSQIIVAEGEQNMRAVPQTLAGNLQVLLQLYSYGASLPLYQKAVTTINGTGMAAIAYTH